MLLTILLWYSGMSQDTFDLYLHYIADFFIIALVSLLIGLLYKANQVIEPFLIGILVGLIGAVSMACLYAA